MIPGALGTDTAGSVRNPATACGIVGMKPSYGAISRSGVFPLAFSLDHIGPMTRTVADNALLYDACIGHDRQDPTSVARLEPVFAGLQASIRGMRIGVIEAFNAQAHPEIQASLAGAFKTLESLGAVLVPVQLPDLEAFSSSGRLIIQAESYAVHKAWMRSRAAEYGWRARTKILAGAFVDAASYIQAQQARRALCGAVEEVMRGVDALVCASSLELTSRIDDDAEVDRTYDRQARTPFNLTGSPAIAVPSGFASNGLPIGFQIVGKLFDEASVYRIAHAFEMAQPWAQHRPL
jgi:aspartyl-tRNA(Asn)/glutamyl-tRNA(Gln) amidotransferase subunit A